MLPEEIEKKKAESAWVDAEVQVARAEKEGRTADAVALRRKAEEAHTALKKAEEVFRNAKEKADDEQDARLHEKMSKTDEKALRRAIYETIASKEANDADAAALRRKAEAGKITPKEKIDEHPVLPKVVEKNIKEKVRKLCEVSTRVRIDMLRDDYLKMERTQFTERLVGWAAEFGFKIDGDYISIEGADVNGFIESIDTMFGEWDKKEKAKSGKMERHRS